jgi:hypothetical protein
MSPRAIKGPSGCDAHSGLPAEESAARPRMKQEVIVALMDGRDRKGGVTTPLRPPSHKGCLLQPNLPCRLDAADRGCYLPGCCSTAG